MLHGHVHKPGILKFQNLRSDILKVKGQASEILKA